MNRSKLIKISDMLLRIIIVLSTPFLTLLLSNCYKKGIMIGVFMSFFVAIITCLATRKKKISIKKNEIFVALILTLAFLNQELIYSRGNINENIMVNILNYFHFNFDACKMIGLLAFPSSFFIIYFFIIYIIPKVKEFIKSFNKIEKVYFVIILIIGIFMSFVTITSTTAFSNPFYKGKQHIIYDVIYTSDSGAISDNMNAYYNPSYAENDIRQPLFGIFSLPFSIPIEFISNLIFLFNVEKTRLLLFTITQFILLSISTIMLSRIMRLNSKENIYFYLLVSLSFPYLLFSIVLEQYVIGLFYLILTIYLYFLGNLHGPNYSYVGAVGTLITSGVIFPLISDKSKFKDKVLDILKCFIFFMIVLIIGGQLPQLFTISERIESLSAYNKNVPFISKIYQYSNFVSGLFFANKGKPLLINGIKSYRSVVFDSFNYIGLLILILCLISFIINRKDKISFISFLWIVFSFVVLVLVGWGSTENGMVLYSLYFAWAFLILLFNLLRKIKNKKVIFNIIFILLLVTMIYFNFTELINILKFGIKYYPSF